MLSELYLQRGKDVKAFTYLNHCLKLDYKNQSVWSLLGELYKARAEKSTKNNEEKEFNLQKAVLCQSKALKYESELPS